MKQTELTKLFVMISNWNNSLVSMVDTQIFQHCVLNHLDINELLFGLWSINIFNQLGETSDLFLTRQCWWVESDLISKVYFLYHSMTETYSWGHIVSARYYCNTCFELLLSLLHLAINKKNTYLWINLYYSLSVLWVGPWFILSQSVPTMRIWG